ncbi:serine hydrolase domain-containing protein [Halococcoides cellulosivorans]|uniref:Serine hydrolase n=1 Tax=Halococcoides cellulosivorans TaxID=1679096 RepID=A0A2R4WZ86_9EURY|nr:serine hydrolase domain-containing protein [Halococcoides cellulosivorans]AWB26846.1 serine hydrolase [Halococcoides cellulosivorans]
MQFHVIHTAAVLVLVTAVLSAPIVMAAPSTGPPDRVVSDNDRVTTVDQIESAELTAWLDETMPDQLDEYQIPGAAVVVVADGEIVLARGYGMADLDTGRSVVADETVFSVGSTGKLVTWTAVMQGVEDGHLDLDRDVNAYLTESTVSVPDTFSEPVTLQHLGTHTAGFEDSVAGMVTDDPGEIRSVEAILTDHQPARVRPPGQYVAYSNYGTALAGHVVAEQSGMAFTDYADERIFGPLGMDDTTYAQPLPTDLEQRRAIGYTARDGSFQAHEPPVWTLPPEGGSMRTTATDMGQFMLAHLDEDESALLTAESIRDMQRRHVTKSAAVPNLNGMGYGFIEMDRTDERTVGHWGTTPRFSSLLALVPAHDTGLFVVYNSPGGNQARTALLDAFAERYYPRADAPGSAPTAPAGAAERAQALAGDYRSLTIAGSSWERILGVTTRTYTVGATDAGELTTTRMGEGTRTWVEREPGVYLAPDGNDMLVFEFDEDGRATHMYRHAFGPATYERVPAAESLTVIQALLAASVMAFLSVVAAGIGGAIRRRRGGHDTPTDSERAARWLLGGVSLLWLVVLAIFVLAWINFNAEAASPSLALRAGLILRWIALAGTIGAVAATLIAWREEYWGRLARVHYTLATAFAVLFVWPLSVLGIIPL